MSGYWIVWYAAVQDIANPHPEYHLNLGLDQLRHHHHIVGADYEYDPDGSTVAFGLHLDTVTRTVAVHYASRALRESLHRADIGIPYPRPYGPAPVMRLVLEPQPHSARLLAPLQGAHRAPPSPPQ